MAFQLDAMGAIKAGNVPALERALVADRRAITRTNALGMNPLHAAAQAGSAAAVEVLLEHGALVCIRAAATCFAVHLCTEPHAKQPWYLKWG